jgi:hypothetical protein
MTQRADQSSAFPVNLVLSLVALGAGAAAVVVVVLLAVSTLG